MRRGPEHIAPAPVMRVVVENAYPVAFAPSGSTNL